MAKISELIEAGLKVEATKPLAEALKAELGELAGVEAKDVVVRLTTAETRVGELTTAVKDLEPKAKGAEAAQAKLEEYKTKDRNTILAAAFEKAGKENGLNPKAIDTARRLAEERLKSVDVDLDKKTVTGLTKDIFDALKASDPVLFEVGANPAMPAAGGKAAEAAAEAAKTPEISGPIGYFAQRK
ncbi:MAG TPA: hypothetical protein VGP72_14705 [Planctomycetota bacterium]|jgi:hypothetical protein